MITSSNIGFGDQLGAQMTKVASLLYLSQKYNQPLVFYNELRHFRRGLQFYDVFNIPTPLLMRASMQKIDYYKKQTENRPDSWKTWYKNDENMAFDSVYYNEILNEYKDFSIMSEYRNGIHSDPRLASLSDGKNYDILSGFGTIQEWGDILPLIQEYFTFKEEYFQQAQILYQSLQRSHKEIVSLHLRRGDYLILSSLNLHEVYYKKAIEWFSPTHSNVLVFSDDIAYAKSLKFLRRYEVNFVDTDSAGVDMCLMTLCNHHIIANSSFSFWGALLNKKKNKKVICPFNFVSHHDKNNNYLNGKYYPIDWTALKNGNGRKMMRRLQKSTVRSRIRGCARKLYQVLRWVTTSIASNKD